VIFLGLSSNSILEEQINDIFLYKKNVRRDFI